MVGSIGGSERMRMFGMASGMDIDKMVDKLMKAESMPLQTMKQDKQIFEWRRDDYRDMNKILQELDNTIFGGIDRQSNLMSKTVTSSNESAVTATASADAAETSTQINVTQLASSATWVSSNAPDQSGNYVTSSTTLDLTVTNPDGSTNKVDDITIESTDSFDDVIRKINDSKDLKVNAFYDSANDKFVMTSELTGKSVDLTVNNTATADFFDKIGFSTATAGDNLWIDSNNDGVIENGNKGTDAQFTINGYATSRTTNQFTINNVSYTLKDTTATPATLTVSQDIENGVEVVSKFVEKYNEAIEKIHTELNEKHYRDYPPLTDKQKEEMSEHEIELWNEKARSGMLANDTILSGGLTQMRVDLYSSVENANVSSDFNQLAEIGITTSNDYKENGKLILDKDKLREALSEDPEAVYDLFNAEGNTFEEKGLASRLRDTIENTMDEVERKAGNTGMVQEQFTLGRRIDQMNEEIDAFQRHLSDVENRYYRQFTAMEQAIQRANQQSAFIMQNMGGGGMM